MPLKSHMQSLSKVRFAGHPYTAVPWLILSSIAVSTEHHPTAPLVPDRARLSRPSLSYQYPLPAADTKISSKASLSYPADNVDDQFILTPNVRRPSRMKL